MDDSLPNTELAARVKLGAWLYTQTAGQPFYLFEMLSSYVSVECCSQNKEEMDADTSC